MRCRRRPCRPHTPRSGRPPPREIHVRDDVRARAAVCKRIANRSFRAAATAPAEIPGANPRGSRADRCAATTPGRVSTSACSSYKGKPGLQCSGSEIVKAQERSASRWRSGPWLVPCSMSGVRHEGESAGRPNGRGRQSGGAACARKARGPPPACSLGEGRDGRRAERRWEDASDRPLDPAPTISSSASGSACSNPTNLLQADGLRSNHAQSSSG